MNRGYVKLWRKSIDDPFFKNSSIWHFWGYCLLKASHKTSDCFINGSFIKIGKGQFVFGRKIASVETGLSEQQIRTCLKHLEKSKNLTIHTTNRFSIISIINWDSYQDEECDINQPSKQQSTSNQPAINHIQTLINTYKNKEDVINITSLSSCGENPSELKLNNSSEIKEIFQYWKTTLDHPKARIDEKRKIKIRSALKSGYSVDDIKLAIDGCLASPYHQGENTQSVIYDSLELICRDSEHIDRFIKLSKEPNAKLLSAKGRQARQNGQTWLQMRQQKREAQNG